MKHGWPSDYYIEEVEFLSPEGRRKAETYSKLEEVRKEIRCHCDDRCVVHVNLAPKVCLNTD